MMKASPRGLPSARKPMRVLRAPETTNTPPTPSPENRLRGMAPRMAQRVASVLRTHFENERIRHRFERCKLRGASHGPRRASRAAQALYVQDGPSNIDFFSSEAQASRKENLQLN